jgi:hypothetical protein
MLGMTAVLGRALNIPTVRTRDGKAVVYWPGVVLATVVIAVIYAVGIAGFSMAVGWFSPMSFIGLPMLVVAIVSRSVRLGMRQGVV